MAHEKSEGLNRFRVLSFKTGAWHEIDFPETVYSAFGGETPEFDTRKFRISYQSMITPSSVFDYDLETLERTLLKQQEVLGGYDAAPIRDGAPLGHGPGRRQGPHLHRLQEGLRPRRQSASLALWLRILRLRRDGAVLERRT